jgi:putative two-component system response regulator
MAAFHHERWDGHGYPSGLSKYEIPLSARIMAVADVFDALRSKRSYKEGFTLETTMDIMLKESGFHFDPVIIKALKILIDEKKIT